MSDEPKQPQYTPGPWTATGPFMEGNETLIQIEAPMQMIGEIYAGDESEGVANAKLAAAAPDLLAALQAIVDHQNIVGGTLARMSTTRKIAAAAIEKATT